MATTVGIRELKTRLGTNLRLVKAGARLVVTERGRPIAELRGLPAGEEEEQKRLLELAALGKVTLPTRESLPKVVPVRLEGEPLSATVVEGREDRV
jgi:antitoxin (DNA-binding transcriptional repressor) of toxin-antitoxin stability system